MATNMLSSIDPAVLNSVIVGIIAIFVGCVIGFLIGSFTNKRNTEKKIGDANHYVNKLLSDAKTEAKNIRKEAILEAKDEIQKEKFELEKEIRERRAEVQRSEQRIQQKEETLEKKESAIDKKIETIDQQKLELEAKNKVIDQKMQEVSLAHDKMIAEIEKVSQMTKEEAKAQLVIAIEEDAKKEAVKIVRDIEAEAKETAEKKAKEIVSLAIQRCAIDQASEITASVVALPNDDMKGRIIGREGRNIRALENATGVDLIIDDTPEAVVLSCFDPVRREIARLSLERLIADGRIHAARIEETVEKVKKEVETTIKEAGESAMFDAGVFGLHPDLVKLIGRLKYRTSYGQNVLNHSLEVSYIAGVMAAELGVDVALAKRAGLLHDIGKAVDHEVDGTHVTIGADLAKKYKESKEVIHCILAHHNDVEPSTVEAIIVQCADAISGGRPGARRESIENYVKRLEKLEEIANSHKGVEKSFAIQAGREIRIMVKPEEVDDATTLFLAKEIAKQIEAEMEYPGQIKVNVVREMRSVEYAK